jgi:hypothetical protein
MKNIYIISALLLFGTISFAQELNMKKGDLVKTGKLSPTGKILGYDGSSFFFRKVPNVLSFDNSQILAEAKSKSPSMFIPNKYHLIGDNLYVEEMEKIKKVWETSLTSIDKTTLSPIEDSRVVISKISRKDPTSFGNFGSAVSVSREYLACVLRNVTQDKMKVKLYNEKLDEFFEEVFVLDKYATPFQYIEDAVVTNNGAMAFLIGIDDGHQTEKYLYTSNKNDHYFLVIADQNEILYQEEITVDDKDIFDVHLELLSDNEIALVAGYGKISQDWKKENPKEGLLTMVYDIKQEDFTHNKLSKFSEDFLTGIYTDGSKYTRSEKIPFDISDFHRTADGEYVVTGHRISWSAKQEGNSHILPDVRFESHEIVVITLNSKGELTNGIKIDREASFASPDLKPHFSFLTSDNVLNVVYNNSKKGCFLTRVSIGDGEREEQTILENEYYLAGSYWPVEKDEVTFVLNNSEVSGYRVSSIRLK